MDPINLQYTTIKESLPHFIYEDLQSFSTNANGYHPQPSELIEKIAKKHNIPQENVMLIAGCDEGIQLTAKKYGKNAFVFTPAYTVYSDVKILGGNLTEIYSIKNGEFIVSTNEIKDASLIYLANPNNPSGITPKEKVLELVKNNPTAMVVIDEAYGEFSKESVIDEVSRFKNLIVLRSFSKGYGMAGNRIGYLIADREIIDDLLRIVQWCNVSYLSVGAAISALNHEEHFSVIREEINKRRETYTEKLRELGYQVVPSNINALLIQFKNEESGTNFFNYLKQNDIITSHGNGFSNIGLDNSFVRIAIGSENQMVELIKVIEKYEL